MSDPSLKSNDSNKTEFIIDAVDMSIRKNFIMNIDNSIEKYDITDLYNKILMGNVTEELYLKFNELSVRL